MSGINHADLIPLVAIVGGLSLGALFIVFMGVASFVEQRRKAADTREREESRREIAAYVAEGSITSEDASRLLQDPKTWKDVVKETFA